MTGAESSGATSELAALRSEGVVRARFFGERGLAKKEWESEEEEPAGSSESPKPRSRFSLRLLYPRC